MSNLVIRRTPRELPIMPPQNQLFDVGIDEETLVDELRKLLLKENPIDFIVGEFYATLPTNARDNPDRVSKSISHNGHVIWFQEREVDENTVYLCTRIKVGHRIIKGCSHRLAKQLNLDFYSDVYHRAFNAAYALIDTRK